MVWWWGAGVSHLVLTYSVSCGVLQWRPCPASPPGIILSNLCILLHFISWGKKKTKYVNSIHPCLQMNTRVRDVIGAIFCCVLGPAI